MKLSIYYLLFLSLVSGNLFAQLGDKLTINGYSSFEFEKMFDDKGKGDPNGSYDADLFDLVLNFTPTDRLRIAADLTWEHGAARRQWWLRYNRRKRNKGTNRPNFN